MSLPYFREWVDKWRSSPRVRLMSFETRGIYHEMLCVSWQIGPLPRAPKDIARLVGCSDEQLENAFKDGLKSCWKVTRKGLINDPLEKEREWAISRCNAARGSAKSRWSTGETTDNPAGTRAQRMTEARKKGTHTKREWNILCEIFGDKCLRCGANCRPVKDHILPVYNGGSDSIENLQPLCAMCNAQKGKERKDYRIEHLTDWRERLRTHGERTSRAPRKHGATPAIPDTDPDTELREESFSSSNQPKKVDSQKSVATKKPRKSKLEKDEDKIPSGEGTWRAYSVTWAQYAAGLSWDKKDAEVKFDDEAQRGLKQHLEAIAKSENLRMLTKPELQEGWGRLNSNLLPDARKRGSKTLPGMVRNWFVNDLRRLGKYGVKGVVEPKSAGAVQRFIARGKE